MRIISIDNLKGDEVLAKDIINRSNNMILMTSGKIVKIDYIKRLKDLGIQSIYVEDEIAREVDYSASLEMQIKDQCQDTVIEILHKYACQNDSELEAIKKVAEEIITDVLAEPQVIFSLSTIREKSESTYSHSLNVCALSVIIGFKLRISKLRIRELAIGGLLHDIGFTYASVQYLNQVVDSESELKEIKMHTVYGYSLVEKMEWLSPLAKDIILSHHERLDGSGYPFHMKENRIKKGSRIVAVCDEFDSLVYGNYTKKFKVHDAIDYIVSQAGVLFDFSVVKAFVSSVAAYPTGTMVLTNGRETGIVLRQNPKCPTRPVIRIVKDKFGEQPREWIEKDLTKELTLFITDTISD